MKNYYSAIEDEENPGNWCVADWHGNQLLEADMPEVDAKVTTWLLNHKKELACITLLAFRVALNQQLVPSVR